MRKSILYYLFCLATMAASSQAYAQIILSGTVKDANNEALTGANVIIKGSTIGTTTDVDGIFRLEVAETLTSETLSISLIGYKTSEFVIGERREFNVTLAEDTEVLGEVVITGYTSEEKSKITGAVNTVSGDLISKLPVASIDQAMQGRVPGVSITQNTGAPGEGVSVRIRGVGSVNGANVPLYIVDGVPTKDINSISTQDIATMTILKDAGAAAIYGSRATNGVVIVTTKSGGSKPKIQISSQVGVQEPSRLIKMADTNEYVSIYNEAAANDNATKDNPLFFRPLVTDDVKATLPNVDYLDAILREGILQSHSISISGTENKTRYFVSGTYFNQEGIIKSSDYDRISARANIDSDVKKWLHTGVNLNLTKATTNMVGSSGDGAGGNGGSVVRYAFFRTPAIPIYDTNGNYTDKPTRFDLFGDGYSPVGMLAYNSNKKISNRLFGKFFIDITPFKDFKFTSNVGVDFTSSNQRRFDRNWGTANRINNPNQLNVADGRYQTLTLSNYATYTKIKDKHNFVFLLGAESIKIQNYELTGSEKNFADQETNLTYLGNGIGQKATSESKTGSALLSYFGKVNYDYASKYLATVTLRRDGSSRFGKDNQWGNYYAGSLGWRIDKEAFLIDNDQIDRLLLRAAYGSIGNQEIGNYPFTDMITSGYNYPLGNVKSTGYAVSTLGNSKVKWETSKQLNVGVDLEMFEGKFSMSLDYFNKTTVGLLVKQPLASSSGEDNSGNNHFIWTNNGKILNRGIELALNYSNDVHDFHYSINGNGALLHNEVLQIDPAIRGGAIGSDNITLTEKGYPVGSFYLYEMEGVFQNKGEIFTHALQGNDIQPGDVKYKDVVKDGVIDGNDRKHVGSPIPKVTAGLTINLNYKNWDLSVFFQGAYGQKIFSVINRDIEGFYRAFNVTQRYYDNHWTGEGTTNKYPRASWDASGNNTKYSTRFLEDGSYTRLKNLQLGYTISKSALDRIGFSAVRIYLSGTNLLTFTRYQGLDPEMTVSNNAQGQGDSSAGLDWGTYPSARSYNVGINLTF